MNVRALESKKTMSNAKKKIIGVNYVADLFDSKYAETFCYTILNKSHNSLNVYLLPNKKKTYSKLWQRIGGKSLSKGYVYIDGTCKQIENRCTVHDIAVTRCEIEACKSNEKWNLNVLKEK